MAAEFTRVYNMRGFDKDAVPRWQMVPVTGDRYIALRDGAGLTVTSNNAAVTVTEMLQANLPTTWTRMSLQASDRIFLLHGASKGTARIQARSGAALVVELQVATKNRKTVRLSFNFVEDSAGHKTNRATATAAQWLVTINYIYRGQANIRALLSQSRTLVVPVNLGTEVTWTAGAASEWNTVIALRDPAADLNFFMVWEYEQDATAGDGADAGTLGPNCIFEDGAGTDIGITMSHEMGHFLGVSDHYNAARTQDLMYGITDARGINLRASDVNTMNP